LRDPKLINLRYETAWFSELLVADLLAPPGGGNLSQNISQQNIRASRGRCVGVFSQTEYQSSGAWEQRGSVYGLRQYGLCLRYILSHRERRPPEQRPDQLSLSLQLKHQITAQDGVSCK